MNSYAITFRTSNANGQSDTGTGTFNVPTSGSYVVKAAADNQVCGGSLSINGQSCGLGGLVTDGVATTINLDQGQATVTATITNCNHPAEDGGDNFNTNPMGIAFTVTPADC